MTTVACASPQCQTTAGCRCSNPQDPTVSALQAVYRRDFAQLLERRIVDSQIEIGRLKADLEEARGLLSQALVGMDVFIDELVPALQEMVAGIPELEGRMAFGERENGLRNRIRAFLDRTADK